MGKVVVINHVTLDGVMQAPGAPDEDPRGGFSHGGWAVPNNDEVMGRTMGRAMASNTGALLLGRTTYERFYAYWPHQTDNPFTEVLNNVRKYVASRTLTEPLPWANSTLLSGEATAAVAKLRDSGPDLTVLGSGDLLQSLMRHDLIDEYLLMIHPLVLGSGRRLFPDGSPVSEPRLVDSVTTTTGVVIATYRAKDGVE